MMDSRLRQEERLRRRKKLGMKRQIVILIWAVIFAFVSLTSTSDSASLEDVLGDQKQSVNLDNSHPSSSVWINPDLKLRARRDVGTDGSSVGTNVTGGLSSVTSFNILQAEINGSSSSFPSTSTPVSLELIPGENCTLPGILEFPTDLFTLEQRRQGYLAIHFIASIYVFYALALVCDDYFVPAIECICDELHLPSDVAGATFMAIATSSPELFTNVIGTFITQGDLGVGTILGSAVFNIFAVGACCGLAAHTALPLEWYPLTRDCLFYSFSVILLIITLNNRQVFWYEALLFVGTYAVYIFVMYKNTALKRWTEAFVEKISKKLGLSSKGKEDVQGKEVAAAGRQRRSRSRRASFIAELTDSTTEKTPLLAGGEDGIRSRSLSYSQSYEKSRVMGKVPWEEDEEVRKDQDDDITAEALDEMLISKALHKLETQEEEGDEWCLFSLPEENSLWIMSQWIISWPARFFLTCTVPDCRQHKLRKWYPLTFLMCIVWIASLSYVVSWMMTVIGHTLKIPDSVMGLTFIAAGTSIPEAVSSIIVARQGLGTMSLSNSIGSNTFDILMCLGLPWLIKGIMIAGETKNYIQINSAGLEYSAMILMASLIFFYSMLVCNKFYLDKKVGFISLAMYGAFLVFASLFEMNVFFLVNLPTCEIVE